MEAFTKLVKFMSKKAIGHFVKYVLNVYYKGIDNYGYQIEEASRKSHSNVDGIEQELSF